MKLKNDSARLRLIAAVLLCLALAASCADRRTKLPDTEGIPVTAPIPETDPLPENPDDSDTQENAIPLSVVIGENDFSARTFSFDDLLPGREILWFLQYDENRMVVFSCLKDENGLRSSLRIDLYDFSSGAPVAAASPSLDGVEYTSQNIAGLRCETAPEGLFFSFWEYPVVDGRHTSVQKNRYLLYTDPRGGLFIREVEKQAEETPREHGEARSEDGRYFAYVQDGRLIVEDTQTGQKTQVYQSIGSESNVYGMRGIGALFFTEDNLLFYNITGWEWWIGYGVFDPVSGRNEVFENDAAIVRYDRRNRRLWYFISVAMSLDSIGVIDLEEYGTLCPLANRSGYLASPSFLPDFQESWDMDYFLLSRDNTYFIALMPSTRSLSFYDPVRYTPLLRVVLENDIPDDLYFNYTLTELEDIWVVTLEPDRYFLVVKKR